MEKLCSIKTRVNGKNTYLFINEELKLGVERENNIFISSTISPFQFIAFCLASLAGQLERNYKLEDKKITVLENGSPVEADGHIIINVGRRSFDLKQFNFHPNSSRIICNAVNKKTPEQTLFINLRLTTLDTFSLIGQIQKIDISIPYYLFSELKIVNKDDQISIKIGGGSPAVLQKDNMDVLLFALNRWLCGQSYSDREAIKKYMQLSDEQKKKENRPYYITRFNRNNILFDGKTRATLIINGLKTQLSYMDVAELNILIL